MPPFPALPWNRVRYWYYLPKFGEYQSLHPYWYREPWCIMGPENARSIARRAAL